MHKLKTKSNRSTAYTYEYTHTNSRTRRTQKLQTLIFTKIKRKTIINPKPSTKNTSPNYLRKLKQENKSTVPMPYQKPIRISSTMANTKHKGTKEAMRRTTIDRKRSKRENYKRAWDDFCFKQSENMATTSVECRIKMKEVKKVKIKWKESQYL